MSLLSSRARARRKVLVALLMPIALAGALFTAAPAVAATDSLTITPIEWNVVGLDSNNVSVGPNQYSVGAQVCNITGVALTNVTVAWAWSTTNTYINIDGALSKTIANLAANTCTKRWWTVEITRNSAAYDTTRGFTVTASATDVNSVSTPTAREIYVEHLVSQNRNGTDSLSGPTTVTVGQTVTYVLDGYTATNGYEQLSAGPTLDGGIFEVQSVAATYNKPTGATNTHFYADACGWDPVTTSGTYRSCIGPFGYTGGKAGGDPIQVTVVATVIAAGTGYISGNIYDFSGSSYHYNSDANLIIVTSTGPAPPVAVDDNSATASGVGVPIDVPSNDSDVDGDLDVTSVTVTGAASNGTTSVNPTTGVITYTPGVSFVGTDTFTYQICDAQPVCDTAVVTVTVTATAPPMPPVAVDDSTSTPSGVPVLIGVPSNDSDVDGDLDDASVTVTVGAANGTTSVDPLTGEVTYTPDASFVGTDTFTYSICDSQPVCDTALVTITVVAPPSAVNDVRTGLAIGAVTDVAVTTNDTGTLAPGSVVLWNPTTLTIITSPYAVSGEGTWSVASDIVTFTPEPGFTGDPTPVAYRVSATNGLTSTATVTLTYIPVAVNDTRSNLVIGAVTTVPVLTNDDGDFTVSTLRLVDPGTGTPTPDPVVVAGEGTWTISGADVVFTPQSGFLLDPTPMGYRITDTTGDTVSASVSLDYRPAAVNDSSLGNVLGTVVDLNVLANDIGNFDTTTLGFGPGNVGVGVGATLNAPGQGSWTVSAPGAISFTPGPGFLGDPTPVGYVVSDTLGDATGALMTIAYVPAAADDSDLGNAFGTTVNVGVLGNDTGAFVAGSVRIMDGVLPVSSLPVPGQGTWIVQPDDSISFVPELGFLTDPAAIFYRVQDTTGDFATTVVTVTYLPLALDDSQGGLALGSVATTSVLSNDQGDFNIPSLRLVDPGTGTPTASPVTITGQGVWSISGANVVFTPAPGFLADPDPITYQITDSTGDTTSAQVELDYGPGAADDFDLGNVLGSAVDVSVFDNDSGGFDTSTLGVGAAGPGATLTVPGEGSWSVLPGGMVRFTPEPGFLVDPTPVRYYADDVTGDPADALITITYVPAAADDSALGNVFGSNVNVDVLANDSGAFTPGSVLLLDGVTPTASLYVAGEGTWTVQLDDTITFDPDAGFLTDPSVVSYQVTDVTGDTVSAAITVTYLPLAVDDAQGGIAIGSVATVPVLANDDGDFGVTSLRIVDPGTGTPTASPIVVAGQGTWSISGANVVFTPAAGFLVDPDPISYRVTDTTDDTVSATITLDYVPAAADDSSLGNTIGDIVDASIWANDTGSFDITTLGFGGATGVGATLNVPGEGTWSVLAGGVVRFSPEPGFEGDPTPVTYYVDDVTGDPVDALITITYVPAAADDSDLGNAFGANVNVAVLANDTGAFVAGSVRILDGLLAVSSLVVPGEGTWTIEPDDTITFDPEPGFLTDPTAVVYRVADTTDDIVSAVVTVTYLPQAADDSDLGNTLGNTINVAVLSNDSGEFVPTSVRIVAPGGPVLQLIVAGEGRWEANAEGTVSFHPEVGFKLDPAPVEYRVTDVTGDSVDAQVTITYVPTVVADVQNGNLLGSPAVVNVLNNDTGDFDLPTLRIIDPATLAGVLTLVVPAEGTWTTDTTLGRLTFTPEPGYLGNPTPVTYEITDLSGDVVQALATVTYLPIAEDDESLDNPAGSTVTVPILGNDTGLFDTTSPRLVSSGTPMMSMLVAGEGMWRMHLSTSTVSFAPLTGFTGDPTPVPYRVEDVNGNFVSANVTITYLQPVALALTGASVDLPLYGSLTAILLGIVIVLVTRLRRTPQLVVTAGGISSVSEN